jgi:hypothetical protein
VTENNAVLGLFHGCLAQVYSFARIGAVIQMKVATILSRGAAVGSVYTKKAARSTTCLAIIVWSSICTTIAKRQALEMTSTQIPKLSAKFEENHAAIFVGGSNFGEVGGGQYKRLLKSGFRCE